MKGGKRALYAFVGLIFTAIGIAGLALPLVPGTLFLILAAFCFTRSSPRLERWLLTHPRLGPPILRWRATGSIPGRAKIVALASMVASLGLVGLSGAPPIALVGTAAAMLASAVYIVSRPTG